jgi:hypothetical protein
MGNAVDIAEGIPALILQHELEAAYRTDTLNGWGLEGGHDPARNLE